MPKQLIRIISLKAPIHYWLNFDERLDKWEVRDDSIVDYGLGNVNAFQEIVKRM